MIGHTLWVTRVRTSDERWPCGEFCNQSERRQGPADVDRAEPRHRGHRRGALVRLRHPPHHAARGMAGDAGRHRVVLAQAVRLLRPQPRAGRSPEPAVGVRRQSTTTAAQTRGKTGDRQASNCRNFINGEFTDRGEWRGGWTWINPSTGEVYATAPLSGPEDVDAACRPRRSAPSTEGWRDTTPSERMALHAQARRRDRGERRAAGRGRGREHRQAAGPDHAARRCRPWSTRCGSSPAPPGSWRAGRRASTWRASRRGSAASRSA